MRGCPKQGAQDSMLLGNATVDRTEKFEYNIQVENQVKVISRKG
jgi:hypothetical protein